MLASIPPILDIHGLSLFYGNTQALQSIQMQIPRNCVTAFIGPSGCGKSSLLRCLNRMNDFVPNMRIAGRILFQNQDIYAPQINPIRLRRYIGMVFQRSNPFPQSIFENVAFGLRLHKLGTGTEINDKVEEALRKVGLWDEVKDRLHTNALNLSGGQQQRVCIARAIAIQPQVLLMDEPASALDPIATARIEELILQLKEDYTIVIVTHNLQQAGRCSDYTAFFYLGHLIEHDTTENIFSQPREEATEAYINGRFG
ncbi:phosphate ABC transporter ATP-binding protein [Verrucomicrobia bacterium LW23]|nr:phosphate ABC transporter ATP-binding protein [Verrucomicrobia bacterium LW23]